MRIGPLTLIAAIAACTGAPALDHHAQELATDLETGDPVYPDTDQDGDPGGDDGAAECRTVTISGRVFYNDLRATGRFGDRYHPDDTVGVADPFTASPVPQQGGGIAGDNRNYLGLRDAVVDLYEVDDVTNGGSCVSSSYVGGVTIDAHGDYSWTGQVCDVCDLDHDGANDNGVSVAGKVRLRFCNDIRCFSVRDTVGMPSGGTHYDDTFVSLNPYQRWLRDASLTAPQLFVARTSATVADDYFQNSSTTSAGDPLDLYAQAASVYASLVDTTRVLHLTHGLPYDRDRFGEVQVFYPSVIGDDDGGGAHSHQPEDKGTSRLCIESQMDGVGPMIDPPPLKFGGYNPPPFRGPEVYSPRSPEAWFEGRVVAHEYGHLVHYWQWDGYGKWTSFCYDDPACEEGDAPEYKLAAFKEGWADFVSRVVWDNIPGVGGGCDDIEGRNPTGSPFPVPPDTSSELDTIGQRWMPDVEQALCDVWDGGADNHAYSGTTFFDTSNTSLLELVDHLEQVWWMADSSERDEIEDADSFGPQDTATSPLGLCRFVEIRPNNTAWIAALAANGIDCEL